MHQSKSHAAKGQISIEFLILMSVVLTVGAAIMASGYESNSRISSIANAKSAVNAYLYQNGIENPVCSDTYLKSMSVVDQRMSFDIEGSCIPDSAVIGQEIVKRYPSFGYVIEVV